MDISVRLAFWRTAHLRADPRVGGQSGSQQSIVVGGSGEWRRVVANTCVSPRFFGVFSGIFA